MRDYCDLIDHCDLWLELPTPELAESRPQASGGATAFLRFQDGGLTFALPDVAPEREGQVPSVPVLWSDALGRGVEPQSFSTRVELCFVTGGPEGWRCREVTISGIAPDGSERPIAGEFEARQWLRGWWRS